MSVTGHRDGALLSYGTICDHCRTSYTDCRTGEDRTGGTCCPQCDLGPHHATTPPPGPWDTLDSLSITHLTEALEARGMLMARTRNLMRRHLNTVADLRASCLPFPEPEHDPCLWRNSGVRVRAELRQARDQWEAWGHAGELDDLMAMRPAEEQTRDTTHWATQVRARHQALVQAGFTEEQALTLVAAFVGRGER